MINDDEFSESIQLFISKSFEYMKSDSNKQSIAFAIPDLYRREDVFAEEMIESTMNQIKSLSLKVLFVLLPDQQKLYKQFLSTIQKVQQGEENFGVFKCPTTSKRK